MNINDMKIELEFNNVRPETCLVFPNPLVEGALCLIKTADNCWRVILNERGEYLINKTFSHEHDACMFFLKKALLEPTNRINFKAIDIHNWSSKRNMLIEKYGFKDVE